MGNRAVITVEKKSIGIYLHWNGGQESVYPFLDEMDRRNVRKSDLDYSVSRFVQILGEFLDQTEYTSTSLGVFNGPEKFDDILKDEAYDHGNNGIYLVCRSEDRRRVRRFFECRSGIPEEHHDLLTILMKEKDDLWCRREEEAAYAHEYTTGGNPISDTWQEIYPNKKVSQYG